MRIASDPQAGWKRSFADVMLLDVGVTLVMNGLAQRFGLHHWRCRGGQFVAVTGPVARQTGLQTGAHESPRDRTKSRDAGS